MGAIDDFWGEGAGALRSNFERTRRAQTDPGIKGGANEKILGDFLGENIGARRIALKSSIIDSEGRRSDEVDVSVINEYQPLWTDDREQLLIAEGVDAVYQVKARLSAEELRRAIKNARSVKQLIRQAGKGSTTFATNADVDRFINRIPFFIFAYTSNISAEATYRLLTEELADTPWDQQPDGVFVLDEWSLVNVAKNDGALTVNPPEVKGFGRVRGRSSLASMLWCHCVFVPRITHLCTRYGITARLARSGDRLVQSLLAASHLWPVSTFRTVLACHARPPCAVAIPSRVSPSAMRRSDEPDSRSVTMRATISAGSPDGRPSRTP